MRSRLGAASCLLQKKVKSFRDDLLGLTLQGTSAHLGGIQPFWAHLNGRTAIPYPPKSCQAHLRKRGVEIYCPVGSKRD